MFGISLLFLLGVPLAIVLTRAKRSKERKRSVDSSEGGTDEEVVVEQFAAGRKAHWFNIGSSMVGTAFATDTPLLVAAWCRVLGPWRNIFWVVGRACVHVECVCFWGRCKDEPEPCRDAQYNTVRYTGVGAFFLRGFIAGFRFVVQNPLQMAVVTVAMVLIANVLIQPPTLVYGQLKDGFSGFIGLPLGVTADQVSHLITPHTWWGIPTVFTSLFCHHDRCHIDRYYLHRHYETLGCFGWRYAPAMVRPRCDRRDYGKSCQCGGWNSRSCEFNQPSLCAQDIS